jgi:DNA polymerase-2
MTRRLEGWLFDVYGHAGAMRVWLLDADGVAHPLRDGLQPVFYVGGALTELRAVCEWITRARLPVRLARAERCDAFARAMRIVLSVRVNDPCQYARVVRRVSETFPACEYYNADLTLAQFYFFERGLFPLARCEVAVDAQNSILEIHACDSPWDLQYALPPLRVMTLRMDGGNDAPDDSRNPNHGFRAPLEIGYEGYSYLLAWETPRELALSIANHLRRYDPDVILTAWGDSFLLPQALALAQRYGIELPLNRDPQCALQTRRAQSYWSYGRVMYKASACLLAGRWHIDRHNAFLADDYGLEGIFEIARISQRPVQQVARTSTGSAISAMEIATAFRRAYLIPWRKRQPETFKTALDLLQSDQGGLTYQPLKGLHHDVAELDFVSMYPAIMTHFNISYETVHCACCPEHRVPQIGYAVCHKQRGLIPETLEPLLQKRVALKQALRAERDETTRAFYRRCASAHKWILVTCFGYLGYKNARFGRIEAHEAVTAFGRDVLLRAKQLVEARGFRVLHMLTDSLWVKRAGTTDAEYEALVAEIQRATGLPIALEGIYKWVAFLPSRADERRAVPNRYFGAMRDGELKVRGIELRRRDTPRWLKNIQQEMLAEFALCATRAQIGEAMPRVLDMVARELDRLRAGQVALSDLVLTYHLSRNPNEYKSATLNALVAQQLAACGVTLHPGESVKYVIMDSHAQCAADRAHAWELCNGATGYDVERYTELLLRAAETIVTPFGMNGAMLRNWVTRALPVEPLRQRIAAPPARAYWGPLFEYTAPK